MTEIVAGEYVTNELSKNAIGGTEQMALRMLNGIDPELLKHFQIIHSRPRELRDDLKKVLVLHDLHNDPEVAPLADPDYRKQFSAIVFVSQWQAQLYNLALGIPYDEFFVIRNGIEPIEYKPRDNSEIRLIYHTTPHRGLELLIPAFEVLKKNFDNVTLDVFSSFKIYGWEERDKQFTELFEHMKDIPGVNYHGFQPNSVVREALQKAHIFAYPSIWPETSCIALIEALCAGCLPIHPNLAALPETSGLEGSVVYQFSENKQHHVNAFYNVLASVVSSFNEHPEQMEELAKRRSFMYNNIYNWEVKMKPQWEAILRSLL